MRFEAAEEIVLVIISILFEMTNNQKVEQGFLHSVLSTKRLLLLWGDYLAGRTDVVFVNWDSTVNSNQVGMLPVQIF